MSDHLNECAIGSIISALAGIAINQNAQTDYADL